MNSGIDRPKNQSKGGVGASPTRGGLGGGDLQKARETRRFWQGSRGKLHCVQRGSRLTAVLRACQPSTAARCSKPGGALTIAFLILVVVNRNNACDARWPSGYRGSTRGSVNSIKKGHKYHASASGIKGLEGCHRRHIYLIDGTEHTLPLAADDSLPLLLLTQYYATLLAQLFEPQHTAGFVRIVIITHGGYTMQITTLTGHQDP